MSCDAECRTGDGPAAVKAAAIEQHVDAVESSAATDVNFIFG